MINKEQIHKMLYFSQLKRIYLEECLIKDVSPDPNFLALIQQQEHDSNSILDLSIIRGDSLKVILPILKCQNYIDQVVISSQAANEVQSELTQFIEFNQVDVQIKKRIPQLDLNMLTTSSSGNLIQSSQRQATLYKSPSHVHYNTDRLQQQLQSDRNQQKFNKKQPISSNTKVINLTLQQQQQQQQKQHKKQLTEVEKQEKQSKHYLNSTKSSNMKFIRKQQSNELLLQDTRNKSQHSFSKHKNTSSSPISHQIHENQENQPPQRHVSAYSSSKHLTKNISVKNILEQHQTTKTKQSNKKQINKSQESQENADISLHLKNLINFCNQSILKKSQDQHKDSKANLISARYKDSTIIRVSEVTEEDNPETARFNSEEDCRKSGYNSKGLQKLLQLKTQPTQLLSVFKK